ncbi:hypothetical protein JZU61_04485 [bacterium]|nr:hypothetical protein [bacterium]
METNKSLQPVATTSEVAVFNFFDPVQFETMQRVCKLFSSSELVPDMYKTNLTPDKDGKPTNPENKAMANCMIAIEMAQRIGASPLMIMQNMIIIYGRPSWSSKFLVATVNTCGRFNPLQYRITSLGNVGKLPYTDYVWDGKRKAPVTKEFDGTQIENLQCIAYTSAKGSTELLESAPIDIKLSIQEGWYTKSGSKWQTMTRQMLMYRAASFWTNAYAPELSMGMKTTEEIQDIIDIPYEDVSDKVTKEKADSANKTTITMDGPKDETKPEAPNAEAKEEKPAEQAEQVADQSQAAGSNNLFAGTAAGKTRNF